MGTGQVMQKSEVFKNVGASVALDLLDDQPQVFNFDINHLSPNYSKLEDGFLIVNLFTVSKAGMSKTCHGELVIQVYTVLVIRKCPCNETVMLIS